MPNVALSIYDNDVNELVAFPSLGRAKNWLQNNQLDISGTTILVPYKDDEKIHFIKPSNPNLPLSFGNERIIYDANKDIRIIGAANSSHIHGWFDKIKAALDNDRVTHLNEIDEENLSLVDHGFIIIYKEGEKKVGHQFVKLFEKEKQDLLNEIKTAQVNDGPHINPAKFLDEISLMASNLDIKEGMSYFVTKDKEENQHVYRHTFKQDPINKNTERYLGEEAKWHESKQVKIKEHKSQDHHITRFLIDLCKWAVFAAITAIGAGLILGIFVTPPIGTIVAAVVAVATFVGMSSIGFVKADKNNPTTLVYGTPEFEVESETTFFSRVKQRINSLHGFFANKSIQTTISSTENNDNGESSFPIGIFTTIVSTPIPASESNPKSSIIALIKSSLSLFSFQQENKTKSNCLESSSPSFRN